ncbi:autotransporter assembly complex protein TamA [Chachezhania sediminis]|uniref:autotransporter assembly complex protein TamA n=1 Tax=Chachezhania sediminis TaxID=2599291 RepID=UPI00131B6A09|nr:autotransporter assembly complex family protein [Chachezhania sediminis]
MNTMAVLAATPAVPQTGTAGNADAMATQTQAAAPPQTRAERRAARKAQKQQQQQKHDTPTVTVNVPGAPEEIVQRIRASSAVVTFDKTGRTNGQELSAAALSDYRTFVQVMYDAGYFGPVIHIRLDGREAANIPPLDLPATVKTIDIEIITGTRFTMGKAEVSPLADGTELPEGFVTGQPASTGVVRDAAAAGVSGWRDLGYAKAKITDEKIVANHRDARLDAEIDLATGPKLRFGRLAVTGQTQVNESAIRKIAGFPSGQTFSPEAVRTVSGRLRRTGTFDSVTLTEAKTPNPDGTLDFTLDVDDRKKRRISFGAEIASRTGLDLTAGWTHRNLFGNAERLTIQGRISNIGGTEDIEGTLATRLEEPARLGPDDSVFYTGVLDRQNKTYYSLSKAAVGAGVQRRWSKTLTTEVGLEFGVNRASDVFGKRTFQLVSAPMRATSDRRNDPINPTNGMFLDATVLPFYDMKGSGAGIRNYVDFRGYTGPYFNDRIVFAARMQIGSIMGASLDNITPDYLFFSGGADTVRGQPYQSLGVPVNGGVSGGKSFYGGSLELRTRVTTSLWLVGFYDVGVVGSDSFIKTDSPLQSGAGMGVRYDIGGFGPLRLDIAGPVDGDTGNGIQFYIGIGQAF